MAGKEKKAAIVRHLSKETPAENDKSISPATPKKIKGRKNVNQKPKQKIELPRKRGPGRKKKEAAAAAAAVAADDPKQPTPQRNRKTFLEKELEDILENATGRNTPLDDRALFLPKSRREPEEDTLSVRSLSTFLRARRGAEPDDDVLSLRSVKVRKDDDDNMSVRSLPGKPGKNPGRSPAAVKVKNKVGRPKKVPNQPVSAKKNTEKTKEIKKPKKKPLRLQNKIGAKRRSNLLLKKKVRNAKIAVKRIYKKKAKLKEKAVSVEIPLPVLKEESVTDNEAQPVEPKLEKSGDTGIVISTAVKEEPVTVSERNGDVKMVGAVDDKPKPQPKSAVVDGKRRRLIRGPPTPVAANGAKGPRKRRWENAIHFESTRSPDDSSVIIVQPRLGPKIRKVAAEPTASASVSRSTSIGTAPPVAEVSVPPVLMAAAPLEPSPAVTSTPNHASSTPYFIQTVSSFNALKSQPTAQGDWLVTPSGVVLIQAVPPNDRNSLVEISEAVSTPKTTVVAPIGPENKCVGSLVQSISSEPSSSAPSLNSTEPSLTLTCSAVVPSPLPSPLSSSAAASPCSLGSSSKPPPSISDLAIAPSTLTGSVIEPSPSLSVSAVAPSPSASSPTLSGSAVAPSPSPAGASVADSMLSEKAREAEPAQAVVLPRIPVAKNVHELLVLKSQLEDETPVVGETKPSEVLPERPSGTERRASHDGSFGPLPTRVVRRTGSCDRLTTRSPLAILQLGSEPLPLADAVRNFETDSSFSLKLPLPLPHSLDDDAAPSPPSLLEPEEAMAVDVASPIDSSTVSLTVLSTGSEATLKVRTPSPSEEKLKDEDDSLHNNPVQVRTNGNVIPNKEEKIMPGLNEVAKPRYGGRTKKYSRSLDSRHSLLPGVRRRSHPEPRVINIVTSEDGSRQGPTLAEELRQQYTSTEPLMPKLPTSSPAPSSTTLQVPYSNPSISQKLIIEETPEDLVSKETILSALGLQSLRAAAELAQRKREQVPMSNLTNNGSNNNNYTGTLKTVIKIQRPEKKGNGRMIYKASSSAGVGLETGLTDPEEMHLVDSAPSSKESQESGDEDGKNGGKAKALVIPEKASSFSIHPHRMCSDVCTYCFGKFGLLDTPCHIAQLKDGEKRRNILDTEVHLTLDSCLCDACFRHVDKKSNWPPVAEKKPGKRKLMVQKQVRCCAEGCELDAQHNVRRKSLLKLKKSLGKKLTLDQLKIDKLQPNHLVTFCNRHIYWVDYFMSCGICNKRLTNVHMYRVGSDVTELNAMLGADGIPTVLTEKRFLCKLCQCYASIRLKTKDPNEMNSSQRQFYESCRRRILLSHGIDVPDSEAEAEAAVESVEKIKAKTKKLKPSSTVTNGVAEADAAPSTNKPPSEDFTDLRAKFKPLPADAQGFHKCSTTIQFTKNTKDLFYQLQRPYGNHSSFFRHLVMLEKYFRSGDLVLSRKADSQAVKYVNGVQNRLRSYDGMPQVSSRPFTLTPLPAAVATPSASTTITPSKSSNITPPLQPPPPQAPPRVTSPAANPLSQLQSAVHNIGIKPDISITSVGSEPRKLTPKIQENLRALANRASKPASQTRAVILNRTVGGQKQSLVQVTTGGKTIHLTLSQFRRIQQMQIRKKQYLEHQAKTGKSSKSKMNGPSSSDADVAAAFPHIPKALSVSVTKVPAVDLTQSPPRPD